MQNGPSTPEIASLIIQSLAVLSAVGAAIVALVIAQHDRRNAQAIAAEDRQSALAIAAKDRRAALRHAHLMFELEMAQRLSQNAARGGSTDPLERSQLGAEQLSLVGLLGPSRVPRLWGRKLPEGEGKLRMLVDDPETIQWVRDKIEAQLAVSAISDEIRVELERRRAELA